MSGVYGSDSVSGVNLALTRLRARSPKGKRVHGKRQERGQNVSLTGALGLKGKIVQVSLTGATNSLTFEAFIARKLVPKLWKGACVIMDSMDNYEVSLGHILGWFTHCCYCTSAD
ncbi:transposase [Sphaerothrix gracilis]|uniref:transposase n=1 Tax=Sphaerothrix gracilis TaxID=3151835 RepID=UPI0031FCA66B